VIDVPYVPGPGVRSVTGNGQKVVTRQYECPNPGPGTHRRSRPVTITPPTDWNTHGILAVIAVLALALIADGATLMLIAWWRQ
jgi:hypothetical protein